ILPDRLPDSLKENVYSLEELKSKPTLLVKEDGVELEGLPALKSFFNGYEAQDFKAGDRVELLFKTTKKYLVVYALLPEGATVDPTERSFLYRTQGRLYRPLFQYPID